MGGGGSREMCEINKQKIGATVVDIVGHPKNETGVLFCISAVLTRICK